MCDILQSSLSIIKMFYIIKLHLLSHKQNYLLPTQDQFKIVRPFLFLFLPEKSWTVQLFEFLYYVLLNIILVSVLHVACHFFYLII